MGCREAQLQMTQHEQKVEEVGLGTIEGTMRARFFLIPFPWC